MEAWKSNLENVIHKWEKKGPPAHIFENKPTAVQRTVPSVRQNGSGKNSRKKLACRFNQDRRKEKEFWASLELNQAPKKFKLIPPVIKAPRAPYHVYQCSKCQRIHKDRFSLKKDSSPSSLFNVFDTNEFARKKSFICLFAPDVEFIWSRQMYQYPKNMLLPDPIQRAANDISASMEALEKPYGKQSMKQELSSEILSKCKDLVPNICSTITRLISWAILKFFRKNFSSICCQRQDIEVMKEVSKKNIPILYVPVCKSPLDYVILNFTLFCNNSRLPFTFVSDKVCRSRFCRFILRKLGVVFVGEDYRYENNPAKGIVVKTFTEQLLKNNQSMQIILDHQRVGHNSIISNVLQIVSICVNEGIIEDLYLVPVNVTYDKEFEAISFDTWNMIKLFWLGLKSKFNGMVHVRFGYPYSFQDFCKREQVFPSRNWSSLKDPLNLSDSPHHSHPMEDITNCLVNHVISDCHTVGVISCTSMLSFLLVSKHKVNASLEELEISFDWLKQEVSDANRYLGFFGSTPDVLNYALKLLASEHLVELRTEVVPNCKPSMTISVCQELDKLSRLMAYAHQVTLIFAMRSIVATAIIGISGGSTLFQIGQLLNHEISRNEVLSLSKHLCHILRSEYEVFPPCIDIKMVLSDILDLFTASGVLVISKDDNKNKPMSRALELEDDYDDNDSWDHQTDVRYEVSENAENREFLRFLHSLIAPALERIWYVAASLSENWKEQEMTEHDFVSSVRKNFVEKVAKGRSFNVSNVDVKSFYDVVDVLLDFGLLQEIKDGGNDRKLKAPLNLEEDVIYNEFKQKLEICL